MRDKRWSVCRRMLAFLLLGFAMPVAADVLAELEDRDWSSTPGLVYAVLQDGEIVVAEAHGLASLEHGVPLSRSSRLHAGSVAKPFMAYTILRLAAEGAVDLDDRVGDHLDDLPAYTADITLRNLLQHTSGLRDYWALSALAGRHSGDRHTQDAALALIRRQPQLNFPPGSRQHYSNTGYLLLAEIVERRTDQRWDAWLDEHLFEPLAMSGSHLVTDPMKVLPDLAVSYRREGDEGEARRRFLRESLMSGVYGSGNLVTTVDDLLRFAAHLMEAEHGGRPILETMAEPPAPPAPGSFAYRLGFGSGRIAGMDTLHHGGAQAGYRAHLLLVPGARLAVAVLANGRHLRAEAVAESLARRALEERRGIPAALPAPIPILPHEIPAGVTGLYRLENGRPVTLRDVDGRLAMVITGTGHALECRAPDICSLPGDQGQVRFHRGDDGAVRSLTMTTAEGTFDGDRREPAGMSTRALSNYAGDWYSPALAAVVTLVPDGEGLRLEQPTGGRVHLTPLEEDVFLEWDTADFIVRFERDWRGRLQRFSVWLERVWGVEFERL